MEFWQKNSRMNTDSASFSQGAKHFVQNLTPYLRASVVFLKEMSRLLNRMVV